MYKSDSKTDDEALKIIGSRYTGRNDDTIWDQSNTIHAGALSFKSSMTQYDSVCRGYGPYNRELNVTTIRAAVWNPVFVQKLFDRYTEMERRALASKTYLHNNLFIKITIAPC